MFLFFFSSRRRHTRCLSDWSSDVCSSDLIEHLGRAHVDAGLAADAAIVVDRVQQRQRAIELGTLIAPPDAGAAIVDRSEERRVGKERRSRCAEYISMNMYL